MSDLIKDALKGFALAHALPVVGLVVSVVVVAWGGLKLYGAHRYSAGYDRGVVVTKYEDREAAVLREIALKDSVARAAVKAARDSSSALLAEGRRFDTLPRHSPRLEALPHAQPVDTADLVGVTVESTGEHFILPRAAARYWYVSDSLVGVAQVLLKKYADANHTWADAWQKEHDARAASDSLVALLQSRSVVPEPHGRSWKRSLAWAGMGMIVGAVLHSQIHR